MTKTAQKLLEELERLPKEEQEARASSYLEDLQRRHRGRDASEEREAAVEPYSSFKVLREARLSGPSDASVTYERELYGREGPLDA